MDYTTVTCTFRNSEKDYDFLVPAELTKHPLFIKGGFIAVHAGCGVSIVQIKHIHQTPQIQEGIKYKWAFQVIDTRLLAELENNIPYEIEKLNEKAGFHAG